MPPSMNLTTWALNIPHCMSAQSVLTHILLMKSLYLMTVTYLTEDLASRWCTGAKEDIHKYMPAHHRLPSHPDVASLQRFFLNSYE